MFFVIEKLTIRERDYIVHYQHTLTKLFLAIFSELFFVKLPTDGLLMYKWKEFTMFCPKILAHTAAPVSEHTHTHPKNTPKINSKRWHQTSGLTIIYDRTSNTHATINRSVSLLLLLYIYISISLHNFWIP